MKLIIQLENTTEEIYRDSWGSIWATVDLWKKAHFFYIAEKNLIIPWHSVKYFKIED